MYISRIRIMAILHRLCRRGYLVFGINFRNLKRYSLDLPPIPSSIPSLAMLQRLTSSENFIEGVLRLDIQEIVWELQKTTGKIMASDSAWLLVGFGCVLWNMNPCGLFNAKSSLSLSLSFSLSIYIYIYIYKGFLNKYFVTTRDELISDVLLWTPSYGRAKAGRLARTYIQQLCEDTGCSPEDLPETMKLKVRVKRDTDKPNTHTHTHTHIYIYIYI